MYSAYKLNKQGDNIQPDAFLFLFGTSLLFHGCASWTIKKTEHRRIDAVELRCWRHIYTHTQELLESEEVSSKRLEGRKERKEGRGKTF